MTDIIVAVALLTGSLLTLLGTVGLVRFADLFSRMHAATKPMTLGLILVAAGAALHLPDPASRAKLLLVVVLQLLTAPVGAHLLGRAAYRSGTELGPVTVDELAQARQDPDI
jgi:multicomponent Na+:H+ antiporter subunit G